MRFRMIPIAAKTCLKKSRNSSRLQETSSCTHEVGKTLISSTAYDDMCERFTRAGLGQRAVSDSGRT